jgi:hypothetical protein
MHTDIKCDDICQGVDIVAVQLSEFDVRKDWMTAQMDAFLNSCMIVDN